MPNLRCIYCEEVLPQDQLQPHMTEKHAIPTVQDLSRAREHYSRYYSMLYRRREASATSRSPVSPTSSGTLQGSATDSAKMSTTFSAWKEQIKFAITQSSRYTTADDVTSFRVDRSDKPRTAARSLQKATRYDILEFVSEFQELPSEDRERCNDLIRKMPVFAVRAASSRIPACSDVNLVSERLHLYALEIMHPGQAAVGIEILCVFCAAISSSL